MSAEGFIQTNPLGERDIIVDTPDDQDLILAAAEKMYIDACSEIRGAVSDTLTPLTGMEAGINWATFIVPSILAPIKKSPHSRSYRRTLRNLKQEREILVLADHSHSAGEPIVRIYANELFETRPLPTVNVPETETIVQYLTQDFSLDRVGVVRHFMSAIDLEVDTFYGTLAPLFVINNDGLLHVQKYRMRAPSMPVKSTNGSKRKFAYPLGKRSDKFDQLDALAAARLMLNEISGIEPQHFAVQESV